MNFRSTSRRPALAPFWIMVSVALLAGARAAAAAPPASTHPAPANDYPIAFTQQPLPNGLQLICAPIHNARSCTCACSTTSAAATSAPTASDSPTCSSTRCSAAAPTSPKLLADVVSKCQKPVLRYPARAGYPPTAPTGKSSM